MLPMPHDKEGIASFFEGLDPCLQIAATAPFGKSPGPHAGIGFSDCLRLRNSDATNFRLDRVGWQRHLGLNLDHLGQQHGRSDWIVGFRRPRPERQNAKGDGNGKQDDGAQSFSHLKVFLGYPQPGRSRAWPPSGQADGSRGLSGYLLHVGSVCSIMFPGGTNQVANRACERQGFMFQCTSALLH